MKTATRRSPADRDRAVARLRALTIGTSIASVVAVGGFSTVAALSYAGASTGVTTAAAATTDNATTTGGSTTGTTTTNTTSGTTRIQATAAPTTTSGSAHAATGSS